MRKQPFTVQSVEQVITFGEYDSHAIEYIEGEHVPTDLRGALDALRSQCWDSLDVCGDGTVIAYPADSHMNMRTGQDEQTQVIIKARRMHWIERLVALHEAGH